MSILSTEENKVSSNAIMRSLLQKAVRRNDSELIKKIIAYLIHNNDQEWIRKRLAVMVYEDSWAYGMNVSFENKPEFLISQYLNLAETVKNKEACSLGLMAFIVSEGDKSILYNLSKEEIKHIKYLVHAIQRPNDFWSWIIKETSNDFNKSKFISKSFESVKKASWQWDKSFVIAGAYLAFINEVPKISISKFKIDTPLWVGIDKHTYQGKKAIRTAANQKNINEEIALWVSFQCEGAICNEVEEGLWFKKLLNWELNKYRLSLDEANNIWDELKPNIKLLLADEIEIINTQLTNIKESSISSYEQISLF